MHACSREIYAHVPLHPLPQELSEELSETMANPSALGKSGEALLLAQILVVALVMFPPVPLIVSVLFITSIIGRESLASLQGLVDFLGMLSLVTGLAFIFFAVPSLGRSISPLPKPRKNHALVTTGIYAFVRHPMYSGLILAGFGLAASTHNEARLALSVLLWFILEKKTEFEEKARSLSKFLFSEDEGGFPLASSQELCARYPQYEEYRGTVKKFFPYLY